MYNLLMKLKSGDICDAYDINERVIILDKYIVPYLSGKKFFFDGCEIDKENVERITVSESSETIGILVERYRDDIRNSMVLFPITKINTASNSKYVKIITDEIIEEAQKIIDYESKLDNLQHPNDSEKSVSKNKKNFVVYGHDEASKAKIQISSFVEKIGLNPIILDEKPSKGQTIIEKLSENADVGFAIVIYAPDDTVTNSNGSYKQPRPNVFFEYGYFMGKLGRKCVALLVKNKDELKGNSDITGTGYIEIDSNNGWQTLLAKELKAFGYDVDMNKLL